MLFADPFGDLVGGGAAAGDEGFSPRVVRVPQREGALAQVVFVVEAEFFEAGAGDVGELELGLFGSAAGLAAFGDVLHAAARGLDHLVVGAAARGDIPLAKPDGDIVAKLRELEALEAAVASVLWEERLAHDARSVDFMDDMDWMDVLDGRGL